MTRFKPSFLIGYQESVEHHPGITTVWVTTQGLYPDHLPCHNAHSNSQIYYKMFLNQYLFFNF